MSLFSRMSDDERRRALRRSATVDAESDEAPTDEDGDDPDADEQRSSATDPDADDEA